MKTNSENPQAVKAAQNSNLSAAPESAEGGMSMAPPTFQLKASHSLKDAVSPVQRMAMSAAPIQMVSLSDYNDNDTRHDPSNVTDAWIQSTDEYTALMQRYYLIPTTDPTQLYTPAEIVMACRLMLRALREGRNVTVDADGRDFLNQARAQRGSAAAAEGLNNSLSWRPTNPGSPAQYTDFGKWLLDNGPEPNASTGIMNCWELVMFSAYKAGFATKSGLTTVYQSFATDLQAGDIGRAISNFETALRRGNEQVYNPANHATSPKPLRGDIVIFDNLGAHVAVATGSYSGSKVEIMSLWTQNSRKTTRTTVEDLMADGASGPIRFYSPRWR